MSTRLSQADVRGMSISYTGPAPISVGSRLISIGDIKMPTAFAKAVERLGYKTADAEALWAVIQSDPEVNRAVTKMVLARMSPVALAQRLVAWARKVGHRKHPDTLTSFAPPKSEPRVTAGTAPPWAIYTGEYWE